jgi:serpin B
MKYTFMPRYGSKPHVLPLCVCLLVSGVVTKITATSSPFNDKDLATAFTQSNQGFTLDLLRQLPSESNVFYSPFSTTSALAMVHLGAKSDTLKEMTRALHFDKMGANVHSAFGSYLDFLANETGNSTLKTANKIYQSMMFKPEELFLHECYKHFNVTVDTLDFSQSAAASNTINSWVSQQTEDKIQNLIPEDALDSRTFMVLVNAVYFKGNWNSPFNAESTRKMEFRNGKERHTTSMMYQKSYFRFCHMPDQMLSALEIPYQGRTLSMLILLPTAVDGIASLERNLTESLLQKVVSNMTEKELKVYIPKFKLESTYQMKPYLSALGMPSAFDRGKANFTGMDRSGNVFISEVYHKAFLEVNEEGTEAAAATGVVITKTSLSLLPDPEFRADHPFLFFIRDSVNDVILFAGRFYEPVLPTHISPSHNGSSDIGKDRFFFFFFLSLYLLEELSRSV